MPALPTVFVLQRNLVVPYCAVLALRPAQARRTRSCTCNVALETTTWCTDVRERLSCEGRLASSSFSVVWVRTNHGLAGNTISADPALHLGCICARATAVLPAAAVSMVLPVCHFALPGGCRLCRVVHVQKGAATRLLQHCRPCFRAFQLCLVCTRGQRWCLSL